MWRHWAMNRGRARLPITFISHTDVGTVVRAIVAISGEIVYIITTTPITVSSDVRIWLVVCCRLCDRLSMSLVTRLSRSPRCSPST